MNINRTMVVLLLACGGLGYWVNGQWNAYVELSQQDRSKRPPAVRQGRAQGLPNPPPMAPLAAYAEIVERPLFTSTRRPVPKAAPVARTVARVQTNYKLEGTALTPGSRMAVLRDTRSNQLHRLAEGEKLDGWSVERVDQGHVEMRQGAQELVLDLERPDGKARN